MQVLEHSVQSAPARLSQSRTGAKVVSSVSLCYKMLQEA